MLKRTFVVFIALLVSLVLAGCGGSSTKSVTVNLREFSFTPSDFTVKAGQEVTLNLKNLGALNHNLHIMLIGSEVVQQWEDEDEAHTIIEIGNLDGGASTSVTFTAPETPGTYQFVCSIPGHFQQGMTGTMTVTAP